MKQNIHINNLEEISLGKEINGETIFGNEKNIIKTLEKFKEHYLVNEYVLEGKTLQHLDRNEISETEYNNYLNSIKQKAN